MSKEKILFIINPISGARSKVKIPFLIEKHLNKELFNYEIKYTQYRNHACEIAREQRSGDFSTIVAVGGDGTVNEIGKELLFSNISLAIIPTGSGNGLARHLKIPIDPLLAIETINHNRKTVIDTGKINEHTFLCTSGIGFDAHIGHVFAKNGKRGFKTYVKSSVKEYLTYTPQNYSLKINDKEFSEKAFLVTFANAAQFGNNAYIAPKADIQDGQLDICIMKKFPLYAALDVGIKLFAGRLHQSAYVHFLKSTQVVLKVDFPGVIHIDGEPLHMDTQELFVEIVPQSLKIIVGKDF